MAWLRRGGAPREVLHDLDLVPGERVLASARLDEGSYAVATDRRLVVPVSAGPQTIPWERVAVATWDAGVLTVRETGGAQGPGRAHTLRLGPDEVALPETVHERVRASIVISEHVPLVGSAGARISARRSPATGVVHWTVTFDPGLDARDPSLRAAADAEVERFKQMLG